MASSLKKLFNVDKLAARTTVGAVILLVAYFIDMSNQIPFDVKDKKTWTSSAITTAAEQNNENAQFLLASAYLNGSFVKIDRELGYQWMKKAADNKHGLAALMYAQEIEQQNPKDAETYYKKALDANELNAAPKLANLYIRGTSTYPPKPEEAIKLLEVTAQLGHPPSMALFATIIYDEKSHKNVNAARWLQKAIELEPNQNIREEWSKKLDGWVSKFTVQENTELVNATLDDMNKTLKEKRTDILTPEILNKLKGKN